MTTFNCLVRISADGIKEYLRAYENYTEEEVEEMDDEALQEAATGAIGGVLDNYFMECETFDYDSVELD